MIAAFPSGCISVGQRVEYLSKIVLPEKDIDRYLLLMETLIASEIHYVDPVHELHGKDPVLAMLKKYVPRVASGAFSFELLVDTEVRVVWRWTICLKIRWTPFQFTIHGLVHAVLENGRICYQREYYDPMESIGVIPLVGWFYKLVLRLA